ncbi:tRNA (N(6)-L-threonylcarbamoyladenosine(37)-C(2))-methylthiotransferase MtaB [bacterium]|nr:tRNA (N(6)-L-threonylcarbamoyladenosine(37)-C(2))-methylthiotransferase MtaB [bacterium]MBT4250882.1 tRNA (N(6)-L-threonylcarbamoyladenosine(37)-C(2))-methylthiotransferase MtaB [bacterium]MBT4597595.1 tRNA (N(6)-L-threonylcarbamoyladenosine(37)-C(2))-methylthiotransferase MtaB [bacterium]MBT6754060.1 tRNA (N(6)-L-threonylcarbamoyladenosine(37)-C(2))-methylthiotransferase MtaB [bacterium]MBT7038090.1 tRNA (N(6)-L-threonylcarbamoyladenosine(37)-C(2))-methylthiotransferase MtaB [bacterium]
MKKFIIKTLGCKVNQYDSLTLRKKLTEINFEYSQKSSNKIDLAIVNSCAVTKTSIKKGRKMLVLVKKENPNAKIVLLGCWAKIYPEEMEKIEKDVLWGVGDPKGLVKKIKKLFAVETKKLSGNDKKQEIHPPGQGERSRYFLKIQDGCEQFCSYCIIPYSRGTLSSRSKEEVLAEIKVATLGGYDEIVLCGIHLGLYGKEKNSTTCDLKTLLEEAIQIKNVKRVRLSSIEVNDVDDRLLELMAGNEKICQHLHLPLQAGADKILAAMNRPYTKECFKERAQKARKLMPDLALTTDVIVGFPGETEENFKETMLFCQEMKFSRIHVFPFSAHEKTPAAKMKNQIKSEVKNKRARKLRKMSEQMSEEYKNNFKGRDLLATTERILENEIQGKSEFYFNIIQKKASLGDRSPLRIGKIIRMKLE